MAIHGQSVKPSGYTATAKLLPIMIYMSLAYFLIM